MIIYNIITHTDAFAPNGKNFVRGWYRVKRVLIVDDACFMRASIKNILQKNGFEVAGEAVDGLDGICKYRELNPDVVTMDITMPEMMGLDALKSILEIDPRSKVIMVSAMGQEGMVRESILLGAKSFIVKPFKEEQIVKVLNQVLST